MSGDGGGNGVELARTAPFMNTLDFSVPALLVHCLAEAEAEVAPASRLGTASAEWAEAEEAAPRRAPRPLSYVERPARTPRTPGSPPHTPRAPLAQPSLLVLDVFDKDYKNVTPPAGPSRTRRSAAACAPSTASSG